MSFAKKLVYFLNERVNIMEKQICKRCVQDDTVHGMFDRGSPAFRLLYFLCFSDRDHAYAPGCFPDYHIVFKIKSKLYFCDYSYFALAIKIFIFCVLQAVIVYSAKKTAGMNFEQKIKVVDIIIGILLFGSTIYYCYFF